MMVCLVFPKGYPGSMRGKASLPLSLSPSIILRVLLNLLLLLHKVLHKPDQRLHLVERHRVVQRGPDAADRSDGGGKDRYKKASVIHSALSSALLLLFRVQPPPPTCAP